MSVDILKQLDRAKRYVEKSQLEDAIEAYQSVLSAAPNHLESMQALGDLYTRQDQSERAAFYYGMLFDRFTGPREEPKALALYTRFLKSHQQPPERVARYALLLQKQNRAEESIEQFTAAALAFELSGKGDDALTCFVRIAQLDPDNRDRHIAVAELAERMGNMAAAARGYLRAGQLMTGDDPESLKMFARAHKLLPNDRSAALLYAQSLLRNGDAAGALALLTPLAATETDATFLETYSESLMRSGRLDDARHAGNDVRVLESALEALLAKAADGGACQNHSLLLAGQLGIFPDLPNLLLGVPNGSRGGLHGRMIASIRCR